jgi:hypothetical protein
MIMRILFKWEKERKFSCELSFQGDECMVENDFYKTLYKWAEKTEEILEM